MVYYNKRKRRHFVNWFTLIMITLLVSFPLFYNLGFQPLRLWDEARNALSGLEMLDGGNLLVPNFHDEPDMWNTKPPFLLLLQAASMSLLGINAFAVRFPAALAGLFTAIAMLYFARRFMNNRWHGVMAALILVTASGYLDRHIVRTGDYDGVLTLFMFLYTMYFYKVLHVDRAVKRAKSIWLMMLFFTLAVMTKGVAGGLFIPGLVLYLFTTKAYKKLLLNKHLYISIFASLFVVGGYYLYRESINPGYLQAVWQNELGGRYLNTLEGHKHPWHYYVMGLISSRFSYWCFFIIPAIIGAIVLWERKLLRFLTFGGILIISYLLIISAGETKLMWYDAPLFPFLSIIAAIGVMYILYLLQYVPQYLFKVGYRSHVTGLLVSALALFFILKFPIQKTAKQILSPTEKNGDKETYAFGYFVKSKSKAIEELQNYCLLEEGYQAQNWFYQEQLRREHNVILPHCNLNNLKPGQQVVVIQEKMKHRLQQQYTVKLIDKQEPLHIYEIL